MDDRDERAQHTRQYLDVVLRALVLVVAGAVVVLGLTALVLHVWEGAHG